MVCTRLPIEVCHQVTGACVNDRVPRGSGSSTYASSETVTADRLDADGDVLPSRQPWSTVPRMAIVTVVVAVWTWLPFTWRQLPATSILTVVPSASTDFKVQGKLTRSLASAGDSVRSAGIGVRSGGTRCTGS